MNTRVGIFLVYVCISQQTVNDINITFPLYVVNDKKHVKTKATLNFQNLNLKTYFDSVSYFLEHFGNNIFNIMFCFHMYKDLQISNF